MSAGTQEYWSTDVEVGQHGRPTLGGLQRRPPQNGEQHPQEEREGADDTEHVLPSLLEPVPEKGQIYQLLAAGTSRQTENRYKDDKTHLVCV